MPSKNSNLFIEGGGNNAAAGKEGKNMYNRTFNINNHIYKRITKKEARRLFNENQAILIAPSNYNINSMWHIEDILDRHYDAQDFDISVNAYIYYNCNSELGLYPAFYVIEK